MLFKTVNLICDVDGTVPRWKVLTALLSYLHLECSHRHTVLLTVAPKDVFWTWRQRRSSLRSKTGEEGVGSTKQFHKWNPVTRKSYTCCRAGQHDDYNRERQPALVPFVLRALAKKQEITKSTAANGANGEREWGWVIGGTGEVAAGEGASAGGPCESRCATGGRRDSFGTGEVKGLTKPWAGPRLSISRSSETIFKTHSPCHI